MFVRYLRDAALTHFARGLSVWSLIRVSNGKNDAMDKNLCNSKDLECSLSLPHRIAFPAVGVAARNDSKEPLARRHKPSIPKIWICLSTTFGDSREIGDVTVFGYAANRESVTFKKMPQNML